MADQTGAHIMRKEYFLGNARKRRAHLVWIDDWPEADDTGLYYVPRVFYGRRFDSSLVNPDYAIQLGQALIAAGTRARQLEDSRNKRPRRYYRYRTKPAT